MKGGEQLAPLLLYEDLRAAKPARNVVAQEGALLRLATHSCPGAFK